MKNLHMISFIILLVGGVNWGLIGIGGFVGANWNGGGVILGGGPGVGWVRSCFLWWGGGVCGGGWPRAEGGGGEPAGDPPPPRPENRSWREMRAAIHTARFLGAA